MTGGIDAKRQYHCGNTHIYTPTDCTRVLVTNQTASTPMGAASLYQTY